MVLPVHLTLLYLRELICTRLQLSAERHSDHHGDLPDKLQAFFPITTASPY